MNLNLPALPFGEVDKPVLEGVALAAALGVDPLIEIPVAAALSALSVPEVNAKIREGTYPAPVQVGVRKRALRLSEVRSWNENPTPSLRRAVKSGAVDDDAAGSQA